MLAGQAVGNCADYPGDKETEVGVNAISEPLMHSFSAEISISKSSPDQGTVQTSIQDCRKTCKQFCKIKTK